MNMTRRGFVGLGAAATALLAACGSDKTEEPTTQETAASKETTGVSTSLALDSAAWSYDAEDDVYYQLGIPYCETPADEGYERLAILVPGAYFGATDNGDGTYTCEVDADGKVGTYTAATAPIVMPVNTPGYSAQSAMAEYKMPFLVVSTTRLSTTGVDGGVHASTHRQPQVERLFFPVQTISKTGPGAALTASGALTPEAANRRAAFTPQGTTV